MTVETDRRSWEHLRELAAAHDREGLDAAIEAMEPDEAVRAILRLEPEDQQALLTTLSPPEAADIIEDAPDEQAADLIEQLTPADAAAIVTEMQSDEQADLIADLSPAEADAILEELAPDVATEVRAMADYADDVAGGLMITEFLAVGENVTVGAALDQLVVNAEDSDDHFSRYVYVLSPLGRLVGVAAASELAAAPRSKRIADVMAPPRFTSAATDLDELREFFEAHPIAAVPVVDQRARLLGITRRTAVLDAIAERTEREMLRMRGIVGGDEVRSLPTVTRSRRRLSWLSINIGLNIVAASVIALYIDTLDQVIALAVFLPIISDMSGASGNQAVAVSMRELSLGLVKPYEVARVWLKEVSVGLINGLALGLLIGAVATIWDGNPWLGVVVGVTLALNTLIAVSVGGTVPLLLKRFGVDPAVASGPILTTVTDICGFFLALSFASLLLAQLT
ncbi:MAG: magnesium transporter [Chloroflexota bacterium]